MRETTVHLRNVQGSEAALGWAGAHTVVVDRPDGRAGGAGLGFNGGQLLGLALGGCFCNDLRYVAHDMGVVISRLEVDVTISLDGEPLVATQARLSVICETADGASASEVIARSKAKCMVANSLRRGLPVEISAA